jgi:hypothetical protein
VDGLHVEGVAEDELDPFPPAQIGEPVPGEDALDGDDEVVAERGDGLKERLGAAPEILLEQDLAFSIEDAQVHGLGVKIDPAVVLMSLGVESHGSSPERTGVSDPSSLLRVE